MTLLLKLCAVALAASILGLFLKEQQSALALPLQIAVVAAVLGMLLAAVGGKFGSFFAYLESTAVPLELPRTLLKGAAVCLVSEFCAALCRESGSMAASQALMFAGRLLTVALCLPLFEEIMDTAVELLAS